MCGEWTSDELLETFPLTAHTISTLRKTPLWTAAQKHMRHHCSWRPPRHTHTPVHTPNTAIYAALSPLVLACALTLRLSVHRTKTGAERRAGRGEARLRKSQDSAMQKSSFEIHFSSCIHCRLHLKFSFCSTKIQTFHTSLVTNPTHRKSSSCKDFSR